MYSSTTKVYRIDQLRGAFYAGRASAEKNFIPSDEDYVVGKFFIFTHGKFDMLKGRVLSKECDNLYNVSILNKNFVEKHRKVMSINILQNVLLFEDENDFKSNVNRIWNNKVKIFKNRKKYDGTTLPPGMVVDIPKIPKIEPKFKLSEKECRFCGNNIFWKFVEHTVYGDREDYKMFQRGFCNEECMSNYLFSTIGKRQDHGAVTVGVIG